MDFWAIFSANLILAIIIITIYFGFLYFLLEYLRRTKEEFLSEDNFVLFKSVHFKKVSDFVIAIMCIAMVLYLLGVLGWFIYKLGIHYLNLLEVPSF